jgi:sodium-dependent dicarboxylate transporter 2/3/5
MKGEHIVAVDYVSGLMTGAERAAAVEHLADCRQCQAAVDAVRRRHAEDQAVQVSKTLMTFAGRLFSGGVTLIAPSLKHLSRPIPDPIPETMPPLPQFEPLRVLQPRMAAGARRMRRFVGRFGLVLALTIVALLLPTPSGLSDAGHRALALFVFTGSILALEPVSLPIAALMVPLAQVALGIAQTSETFQAFSRPVVFLILASLFLAEGLHRHGLTRRIALRTLVATGGVVPRLLLGIMLIAALFSMWVENTATAAVLIPVALTVAAQVPDPKKAKGLLVLLVVGIAYSASLGGMATVMGSGSNAVAAGFLQQLGPWSFVDWMVYGLPAFLIIFPLTWFLLVRMVKVDVQQLDVEPVRQQISELGPMSRPERELLATMAAAIVLWVGGSFIEEALGLPSTLLAPAMIAVMAVAYLAIREVISWEDVKGVSWGIFFTIGAGLTLGEALNRTGATDWFAGLITPLVSGPPLLVSLMLLVLLSALLTNVMNNTTIAAVFVPILISLAQTDPSLNPVQLVMPVTLATTFGYSLPSASGRMALIASSGIVERSDMMRYGIVATLISSLVLGLLFYLISLLNLI